MPTTLAGPCGLRPKRKPQGALQPEVGSRDDWLDATRRPKTRDSAHPSFRRRRGGIGVSVLRGSRCSLGLTAAVAGAM
jgi:hypothetical protein